ncbi:MAG TPA: P-II family nitrogen regulator [Polyangia bacterium]|jgi:nitrogen regulatory protein P-II 1|nr:P-II family nitrogen regulator [Polyangia bacterium]
MKKIEAIVRPHRLGDVVNRLHLIGVPGMTISDVFGNSAGAAFEGVYHGLRYRMESSPRCQLMAVVPDELADACVRAILHSARTEEHGDGIIAVSDVIEAVRIRTGEIGPDCL